MAATIALAGSGAAEVQAAVRELQVALAPVEPVLVLAFHSVRHPASELALRLRRAFPAARTVAVSTTGEVLGRQQREGTVVAWGIGGGARVAVEAIRDVGAWRYAEGPALLGRLTDRLGLAPSDLHPERHLLLVFADGLTGGDELLLAALRELAPSVPLVGASAADDFRYHRTWTSLDGIASPRSAVVVLLEPALPFRTFAVHHYRPRGHRAVVTASDPARRLLLGLDGWSAVEGYSRISGTPVEVLRSDPEAASRQAVQLARRGQDGLRLRAAMAVRGDALVMAGSVEEGAILEVVEAEDIVAATERGVREALTALPGRPQALLLFDCGGRVAFARHRGLLDQTRAAASLAPAVGMCTYGEYHGARLLNLTLTGVAFGGGEVGGGEVRGDDEDAA